MLGAIFDKWWSQSELKSYFVEKKDGLVRTTLLLVWACYPFAHLNYSMLFSGCNANRYY